MDLNYIMEYINPLILGICLLVGYVLKTAFRRFPNRYIPLAALTLGTGISIIMNYPNAISAERILGGMISGLASTGFYEMLRNFLHKECKKNSEGES